ncbi:hypothetical protein H8R94_01705 [Roseburia sp. NSJ-9]|uniref:Peptidase S8/S53 domain-containing protein n=1 Tax=Roseburia lenta TaxID=2763061 RepID=A0ABR7GEV1_9FIRM|nr:S8 family serine peptidase [Roseburia lenta]MBC5685341.1 hypothetical protein [Roseburia lenta]
MKKFNAKKVMAQMLAIGVVLTTLFPGTAYAAEVGEQVSDTTDQITSVLTENSDLIEQAVIEAIQARGGDINDQALVDQVQEEVKKKIENGELELEEKTEEETTEITKDSSEATTEDTNTSSESVSVTDHTSADEVLSDGDNSSKVAATRLIVTSDVELTEFYGAVTVDHYDNIYVLAYKSVEETDSAYNSFVANGITVEKDASVDAIKEDEVPEDKVAKEVTDTEVTDVVEDTSAEAQPVAETVEEHKTIVAVIDTGISDVTNDDTFKDRIIEGTSTISDTYVDDNGHGTAMAKIIAEDTADENVMLLPIKALDKDGKGTVLSVALAIKYAKEHGADVINLSLSGVGQSNILTNAINDCYNNGITVVTAAGNDNADAMEYIPGNVDAAINIAAAEEDADGKIVSASYTNHGENIDFAALGTYKLVVIKEKTTLETELRGTSIASAHVAAYVALLKQINSTVDGVVSPVSESDVMESLIASADDFDGTVNHTYFGNGFLAKENLVFLKSDVEDQDKETDADETEDDRNQKIEVATKKTIFIDQNHWWGFNDDNNWSAGGFDNAHPNGSPAQGLNVALAWFRGAGCDELEVCMMGNVQTYDSVFVPINMKLTIYGESIFSAGQKTWQRIGSGGDSPVIGGATSDNGVSFGLAYNEHTKIELHTVNIWDNTSTVVSFGDTPGAVSSPDIYAESCSFFSENHWWSVGTSNGTFNKCTFDNTWGHNHNVGAIASWKYLTCTNCTFSGNGSVALSRAITYSGLLGGGLDCRGSMYIDGCTINNYGGWNTAIGCSGNVTIKNTTINVNKNTSSEDVGIIYGGAQSGQSITIDNCNVYNAGMEGIRIDNNDAKTNLTKASISNSTIHGCDTGIKVNTGTAAVSNCNIYSNKYGISNNGTVTMISGDIHNNTNYGVFNSNTFTMNNGSIYSNNYGFYNEGTAYLRGGTIYSNTHDGIRNAGTFNISGGTIKNNKYGIENGFYDEDSILKSGTMNMSGGVIQSNTQDGIYNYSGNATITGGTIKDNQRYGTYNKATMNYAGGASGGNVGYDVYQNGNYKMSGSASTYSNGVYLTKGKMIEITGALTCADGAIKVTIEKPYDVAGRIVASCTYGMNKNNADAMLKKFTLNTTGGNKYTQGNRKAVLRSATGTNGTVGNIILSEEYYVTYDGNVQNVHVTFKLPERQTIYWKEDVDVPTVGTTVYYDGRVFQTLRNVGYSKTADGKGTSCKIGQTMHFSANEVTKDQILYAQYTTAADLSINGNTQTAGDNYVIYGFVSNETALPDNTFEKIYSGIEYDENLEKDIPYKTIYSHHGWSYSDQAMYKDSGVGKCGETFDLTPRILEMINNGQESVSEEGYINNVTLYAVWDEPPKITAKNKYWNTDAIRAGKLNKEDLLRTASAKDKEDGTDVTLEVEDFDIEKFLHLGEYGWMSVRYKATDGAGNVSYKLIKVVVVQSGIVQGEFYDPNPAYVRMIDRENYNKKSHEEGGLMEDSVWYTIPTYKKTILDAFDRLDNGEAIVRYHFSCKDIREAQAFETEAMENGTYPTAAHWEAWLKKFEHCKVFDTGYRSSKELNNSIDPEDYEDYEEPEE